MVAPRIALIHALRHSPPPIEAAFAAAWPDVQLMNLLDDSLSADLARDGALNEAMTQRFVQLGRYAAVTGADAILFTCSAFGPCIDAVTRDQTIPVLKPNEAMIEEAEAKRRHRRPDGDVRADACLDAGRISAGHRAYPS